MARPDVTTRMGRARSPAGRACRSGTFSPPDHRRRLPTRRAGLVDRRRAPRRRACVQALRPPAADRPTLRRGPRALRGRRRQEHERGGQRSGPTRADRLAGRVDLLERRPLAGLPPDGAGGSVRNRHALPRARDRAWDRLAWIGPRCSRDAQGNRDVVRRAPARGRRRPGRRLDPTARPARRARRPACLPRARGRRLAVGLASAASPRRSLARPCPRRRAGRGRLSLRQRLQRLRDHPRRRGPRRLLRRPRHRDRAAALARDRRPIDGRLCRAERPARPAGSIALRRIALLALLGASALGLCAAARASAGDEQALAKRYAPVVRLVEQKEECGPGEPYQPLDVDALFGQPTVALRGPWNVADLVKIGPTARDLTGLLYDYHLDFPGDALSPGCGYERWARLISEGHEPTVYAHVATEPAYPGRLALQYWLFYVYNDWNNLHEGDWEMIQLDFDAVNAGEALTRPPASVGYSQHEGAEEATWGDDKLHLVDGTHPVVYPAAGSHANFYGDGLFLGSSAEQGVGCDNTNGPHSDLRPAVATIPSDPAEARGAFPWIDFQGRWGELQPAFFNGPTGPNLKEQWTAPITWSEGWRDQSFTVPAGSAFGTTATDFFCRAIGNGSRALVQLVHRPLEFTLALALLALLLLFALSRTSWRPTAPLRLAHRRAWGQTLAAATRMYLARPGLMLGIGVLFIPIAFLIALLQSLLVGGTVILGVETGSGPGGLLGLLVLAIGTALTLLGLGLAQAATARALIEVDRGRQVGPVRAYVLAADSIRPLLRALLVATPVVSLLASSLYLIPIAIWLAGRWALVAPSIELERLDALAGLRRSRLLVQGAWLKVTSLIVVGAALSVVVGPVVGALLILATSAPFWLVNVIAGVIYTVTMPLVALMTTYVYFDRRVADELAEPARFELPAEIELSS